MPDTTSRATRAAPRPPRRVHRSPSTSQAPFFLADLTALPGVPCPCGTSRRAFVGESGAPCSIHRVEISRDAQAHYHKRLTEIYYFLEGKGHLELDGVLHPVRPGMAVLIRPGTRHRAVVRSGAMTILNVVVPQFDPRDEWLDP
jgi:mannose-6-phosphate isomerase-like protein (cupin superfamily)